MARDRAGRAADPIDVSIASLDDPRREVGQAAAVKPRALERRQSASMPIGCELSGRLDSVQRRVSRLPGSGVLARRLSQIAGMALDVEDVIDNLEGEPDLAT